MDAGWREDRGEAIQELESREAQRGPTGGIGFRQEVENLVRTVADQVEPFESKRWSGTIPNQPFQPLPVGGLDTDAGVQAEAATVIPREHILCLMGLQEAVATEMPQDPGADRVLETLQEFGGEGGGFVEAEAGCRAGRDLIRLLLDLLEEPIHDADVVMEVGIEGGAEAMEEADGSEGGCSWSGGTGLPESGLEGPKENVKDDAGGSGPVMEEGPEAFGDGQHPLAHRDVGKDVIHQVGSGLGHALGVARRAGSPTLAGKGHQEVVAAARASGPSEAVGQDTAGEIAPELLLHVIRHAVAHGIGLVGQGEVGLQVLPDDAVQGGGFGPAPTIGLGMGAGRRPGWRSGPPGLPVGGVSLCGHQWPLTSMGTVEYVSTSKREMGRGGGMGKGGRRGSWCPEE
jgi:hypothetical protein